MAQLPVVGGSAGIWGSLLNEYLSVGHLSDGRPSFPGLPAKYVYATTNSSIVVSTGGTQGAANIYALNTAPTSDKGTVIFSQEYTPVRVGNILHIEALIPFTLNNTATLILALFRSNNNTAIAAGCKGVYSATRSFAALAYDMTISSLSQITFILKAGIANVDRIATINNDSSNNMGGLVASGLWITEYWT